MLQPLMQPFAPVSGGNRDVLRGYATMVLVCDFFGVAEPRGRYVAREVVGKVGCPAGAQGMPESRPRLNAGAPQWPQ